eukprot:TRINITY_DN1785_c0_g1_i1.p1 TRINITY_DN1785_c0_g1~~TRINITY_DN1785_c0_g1_i1.p1  ORF type:complete len:451 (+),score=64.35 TRINITY_DN1785_c0_g1_i1:853-2205(+)
MDNEFIVPLKNSWDIHPFSFVNESKSFVLLAECSRGTLIIELKSIIGVLFATNPKYPQTMMPVKNFILMALKTIKGSQGEQQVTISSFIHIQKETTVDEILKQQHKKTHRKALLLLNERTSKMGFSNTLAIQKQQINQLAVNEGQAEQEDANGENYKFRHVGYCATAKTNKQILSTNYVVDQKIKINSPKKVQLIANQDGQKERMEHLKLNIVQPLASEVQYDQENNDDNMMNKGEQDDAYGQNTNDRISKTAQGPRAVNKKSSEPNFTQGGVRKLLHPKIPNEFLNYNQLWIPGQLNDREALYRLSNSAQNTQYGTLNNNKQIPENFTSQSGFVNNTRLSQTAQSKRRQNIAYVGLQKSLIRGGRTFGEFKSIFEGEPYISQNELEKKRELDLQTKILAGKSFKVGTKMGTSKYFSDLHCFETVPYDFSSHQFREEIKDKWIGPSFKLV